MNAEANLPMKRTPGPTTRKSAEAVAKMADEGQDVSQHFTNKGKMNLPIPKPSKANRFAQQKNDQQFQNKSKKGRR